MTDMSSEPSRGAPARPSLLTVALLTLLLPACPAPQSSSDTSPEIPPAPAAGASHESPSPAARAERDALLQRALGLALQGKPGDAIALVQPITVTEPENGRAWLVLGVAQKAAKEYPAALVSLGRAMDDPRTAGAATYQSGLVHLLQGDVDQAFEWLLRARASYDTTRIAFDPAAVELSADPRYPQLFPTADELADPFVEPTLILHQWIGEAQGDQFGWIARNIGDVDGDGVNDVTTSAPTNGQGGSAAGKIYVYSGRSGALMWSQNGAAGDQLGIGIEAAGDVNGDGVPDVVAGAPGGDVARIYSGRDGAVLHTLEAEAKGDGFGTKAADVGDIDGDGHADILVGAPQNNARGEGAGAAYVYSGKDGAVLATLRGEQAGDGFGSAAAGAVVGDQVFVVVGAPNAGPGDRGRVYVYRGTRGSWPPPGATIEPAFTIDGDPDARQLGGMFVSVVGDVDHDGTRDVYASDWMHSAHGTMTGRVYVVSGVDGRPLHTLTGETRGDGFGIGPADAGDVDGDGHDDLIIGAWQHGGAAPGGGKVTLYSGKTGAVMHAYTGKVMGETLGFDATGMGDVDGDGTIDFLLTSAWSTIEGPRSGRVYIVSGKKPGAAAPSP
ncbi:FG-GAP-like repeat-containing protein [Haliangium sp.]|uniref:FG-GAP-like repeat-containing protein n=2 Tax=Haliangium sp. TaxID=2663208 RepID=UPI003D120CAB